MIEHGHPQVSIVRQCELLKLSRSSVYYVPREQCQEDLDLMYQIDQQHLETPYYGSRKMRVHLERKGHLEKLSAPFQLTKRSQEDVEEPAYFMDSALT